MRKTHNSLPPKVRKQMAEILNHALASAIDLYGQVKHAHWNVRGEEFAQLHKLFDDIATDVLEYADLIAERVVQLGIDARGTIQHAAEHSSLKPYPVSHARWQAHVEAIARGLAAFGEQTRTFIERSDKAGDAVTNDILVEICRGTDKWLWMVESHLDPS